MVKGVRKCNCQKKLLFDTQYLLRENIFCQVISGDTSRQKVIYLIRYKTLTDIYFETFKKCHQQKDFLHETETFLSSYFKMSKSFQKISEN